MLCSMLHLHTEGDGMAMRVDPSVLKVRMRRYYHCSNVHRSNVERDHMSLSSFCWRRGHGVGTSRIASPMGHLFGHL